MPRPDTKLTDTYHWKQLRKRYRDHCHSSAAQCWLCHKPIDYQAKARQPEAFEPDHYHSVITHPDLAYEWNNLRPSHSTCNRARGAHVGNSRQGAPTAWSPATW